LIGVGPFVAKPCASLAGLAGLWSSFTEDWSACAAEASCCSGRADSSSCAVGAACSLSLPVSHVDACPDMGVCLCLCGFTCADLRCVVVERKCVLILDAAHISPSLWSLV